MLEIQQNIRTFHIIQCGGIAIGHQQVEIRQNAAIEVLVEMFQLRFIACFTHLVGFIVGDGIFQHDNIQSLNTIRGFCSSQDFFHHIEEAEIHFIVCLSLFQSRPHIRFCQLIVKIIHEIGKLFVFVDRKRRINHPFIVPWIIVVQMIGDKHLHFLLTAVNFAGRIRHFHGGSDNGAQQILLVLFRFGMLEGGFFISDTDSPCHQCIDKRLHHVLRKIALLHLLEFLIQLIHAPIKLSHILHILLVSCILRTVHKSDHTIFFND